LIQMTDNKIIIASGPVIIEDGKVLLNRHGKTEEDQKIWKFPGGRVEFDNVDFLSDNILENECKREVMEEMGLEIEIIRPLKPMLVKISDNISVVLIHYLATRIGEVKLGSDIIDSGWFPLDKLPENCAPNIAPVIAEYLLG